MPFARVNFLGLPLNAGMTVEAVCRMLAEETGPRLVSFINPQAWALARKHPEYLAALAEIPCILPDGEGVASVYRKVSGAPCTRVSFDMSSLADPFFRTLVQKQASLMLVGGEPGIADQASAKLQKNYPGLRVTGTDHGFGEWAPKLDAIMALNPDAVIIGMGAPHQEKMLLALRDAGYQGMAITCGGFLDQYVKAEVYYPAWIDRFNLRFAYRLYKEPGRLWRRYLIDYQVFIWRALRAMLGNAPRAVTTVF